MRSLNHLFPNGQVVILMRLFYPDIPEVTPLDTVVVATANKGPTSPSMTAGNTTALALVSTKDNSNKPSLPKVKEGIGMPSNSRVVPTLASPMDMPSRKHPT